MTLFLLQESKDKKDVLYYIIEFGKREGRRREGERFQVCFSFRIFKMKPMMWDRIPMKVLFSLCLQFVCKPQLCYFYCRFQQEFRGE